MEADMKGRLRTALQKQTIALGIWTEMPRSIFFNGNYSL